MKSIVLYRMVAIFSFVILLSVQFYLAYNTYKLKNEQYFLSEKNLINQQYTLSIRNDKVFPGAQPIIDSFIYRHLNKLGFYYKNHSAQFNILSRKVCDSIFYNLRLQSNMDSLFKTILVNNNLNRQLVYLLTISNISVTFDSNKAIPIYKRSDSSFTNSSSAGEIIDGSLTNPNKQNQITDLTVSNSSNYSYQISFSLFVDMPNRQSIILQRMLPIFLLSAFSIFFVILIYYFTYRNWLKQKQLAEMQSDFVNSITHEFNTPLSTIIVSNKNLQNPNVYSSGKMILPLTEIIDRQSQRLKILFGRVLDITKMNELTLDKKEYVLSDLTEEILLDYRLTLGEKNVDISYTDNEEEGNVLLDKFWFTTMLINIFENAIKYNRNAVKKIDIHITRENDEILLSIKDNGIGIPPYKLKHIFDKFYRGKGEEIFETSGLGLGLFYTKQCIQAHKWKIDVNSDEQNGTTFLIYMPLA